MHTAPESRTAPGLIHFPRSGWGVFLGSAALVHGLALAFLIVARTPALAKATADRGLVSFRLIPPPEGDTDMLMPVIASASAGPARRGEETSSIDPSEQAGDKLPGPTQQADANLADILARDREALQKELDHSNAMAQAQPLPRVPLPAATSGGDRSGTDQGPEGAIRELDLGGYPQTVVDEIMARYNLKVVTQKIEGGRRGQSFLSSASRGSTEKFFGGMTAAPGIYEVFQLSRGSVALMSRLEEKALRDRGLEPLKARIIRIVFGIVKSETGGYELGVKSLEAEAV